MHYHNMKQTSSQHFMFFPWLPLWTEVYVQVMPPTSEINDAPVNLGKPSLRRRLEAYYSLIAPDQLTDQQEWRKRFDQIYQKYGGTNEGERKLGTKLVKKYGRTVRLLLAEPQDEKEKVDGNVVELRSIVCNESAYDLIEDQKGSGILDFASPLFDPMAVLAAPEKDVYNANKWMVSIKAPRLNHVGQFRQYLPLSDPQRKLVKTAPPPKKISATMKLSEESTKPKIPAVFASIASSHEKGPLSLLYQILANRRRVRVVIRYVNGIRGTLTGYLVAFDKHMNMILRDVDEVYSPRPLSSGSTSLDNRPSNVEVEIARRTGSSVENNQQSWWVRQRYMKQMLVRGDNVVLVYRAEQERSNWPRTSKSPLTSQYLSQTKLPNNSETPSISIGTPGSLIQVLQRKEKTHRERN